MDGSFPGEEPSAISFLLITTFRMSVYIPKCEPHKQFRLSLRSTDWKERVKIVKGKLTAL